MKGTNGCEKLAALEGSAKKSASAPIASDERIILKVADETAVFGRFPANGRGG